MLMVNIVNMLNPSADKRCCFRSPVLCSVQVEEAVGAVRWERDDGTTRNKVLGVMNSRTLLTKIIGILRGQALLCFSSTVLMYCNPLQSPLRVCGKTFS